MRKTMTAVVAAAVVGGIGLPASPANAVESVELRSGDLNTSDTRAAGHNEFVDGGMHVFTDDNSSQAKAAAYFAIDRPLSEVTSASMQWEKTADFDATPGQQIVFDADGTPGNDNDYNILVGEPVYENGEGEIEWWLTNGSSQTAKDADPSGTESNGGNGSAYFGTLSEWSEALEGAQVSAGGWSLGSGVHGDGVISSMKYGDTTYTFTDEPTETLRVHENEIRPDETTYEGWHQGAPVADDQYKVTEAGLELTGKAQVINGYNSETFTGTPNLPLGWTLENASYTVEAGEAWFQVPLFFDYVQGENPRFATLRPATSAGAGEHTISLDDEWISSRPLLDIPANTPTPLAEIVAALGTNYNVLGFGVLADTNGSATVSQITWDDTRHEFENRAPAGGTVKASTTARHAVSVELPAVDEDGNELTYEFGDPVNGETEVAGGTLTYTPNKNFVGKDRVAYTVTDGRDGQNTGFVKIKVAKLTSEITDVKVKPKKVTPKKRATVVVKVQADGEAATGKVSIKDGRTTFGPKKLEDGKVSIKLARLSKGKHDLVAKYLGNKVTTKDNAKFTIKVVKK